MNVLTIYAHHNPQSSCNAVLERFTEGLSDAGHLGEVVDLHAINFDPVLREHDGPNWIDDSAPDDVLEHMNVRALLLHAAHNPLRRLMLKRWIGSRHARGIVRRLRSVAGPSDVAAQQQKVAWADALVFIAPVCFVGFPVILKGWIERVFIFGFAFALKPEAWCGDIRSRLPILTHRKALIINTTSGFVVVYEPKPRSEASLCGLAQCQVHCQRQTLSGCGHAVCRPRTSRHPWEQMVAFFAPRYDAWGVACSRMSSN